MPTIADEDRRLLGGYGEFLPIQADEDVIKEGVPQDALYFVNSGLLNVHSLKDSKRTLLAQIGSGGAFEEVNVFDPQVSQIGFWFGPRGLHFPNPTAPHVRLTCRD